MASWKWGDGQSKGFRKRLDRLTPYYLGVLMMDMANLIEKATPEDTGRARASWTFSKNAIDYTVQSEKLSNYVVDYNKRERVISALKEGDVVYIANALPYIQSLNNGSSVQAPKRFVEISIETALKKLAKEIQKTGLDVK